VNRGLLRKAAGELWATTLVMGAFLAFAEATLTYILTSRQAEFSARIADVPFLQSFIKGLLGVETADAIGPGALAAVAWVHPVILTLCWAHAIIISSRVPAGEIDRGTVDVLLALPVSRRDVFLSETLACVVAGAAMMAAAAGGHLVGASFLRPDLRMPLGRGSIILVNLFVLYLAVAAMAGCCLHSATDAAAPSRRHFCWWSLRSSSTTWSRSGPRSSDSHSSACSDTTGRCW